MAGTLILSLTPAYAIRGKGFKHFCKGFIDIYSQLFGGDLDPHENRGVECSHSKPFRGRLSKLLLKLN